jgi:hypothetical protein
MWSDPLALDVALALEGSEEPISDILGRHNLSVSAFLAVRKDPTFLRKVSELRADVREKGMTFRLKARAQADELLKTSWILIHDPGVSPAVKADLIKATVRWGGLEAPASVGGEGGGNVRITINLGGAPPPMVLGNAD